MLESAAWAWAIEGSITVLSVTGAAMYVLSGAERDPPATAALNCRKRIQVQFR
jgi:hypothetical protein